MIPIVGVVALRTQAAGRTSDFVSIGQLYPTWFRPDLVGLSFRDDSTARRKVVEQQTQAANQISGNVSVRASVRGNATASAAV